MPLIRSISGLRATNGKDLTPELISKYAFALDKMMPKGQIVIGRDGRPSGTWIEGILVNSLVSFGRPIRILGIVPTPTVQLTVENSIAVAGVSITASHNPQEWNGLKFLNSQGVFLDETENKELWGHIDSDIEYETTADISTPVIDNSSIAEHIRKVIDIAAISTNDNLQKIKNKNYTVVVDAVNASGSIPIPSLLKVMNCRIQLLYCLNNGIFPHTPEPIPENLKDLSEAVKSINGDIGIAVDPDADRLVLIDENGEPIGEEKTIALAVRSYISSYSGPEEIKIVINHSSSMMTEKIANEYGAIVYRSPVGEINVVKKMKEVSAAIGGEGSGGVILPECHFGRDSLVGIALVLKLMANEGKSLSELSNELPTFSMIKTKFPFTGEFEDLKENLISMADGMDLNTEDGIKFFSDSSWIQVRASNTEPIVRIIAEAENEDKARGLVDKFSKVLNNYKFSR